MDEILNISADSSEFDMDLGTEESDTQSDSPQNVHNVSWDEDNIYPEMSDNNEHDGDMPKLQRPKRSANWNRGSKYFTESDQSDFDDEDKDKDFIVQSDENDHSSHASSEQTSMSSDKEETEFVHAAGPSGNNDSLHHSEGENTEIVDGNKSTTDDSTDSSSEINIDIVTKLFVKRLKKYGISQRQAAKLILNCSQSNLSEAILKAKRLRTSKSLSIRGTSIYKQMEKWLADHSAQRSIAQKNAQQKMSKPKQKKTSSSQPGRGKKSTQFSFVQLCVLVELYKKDSRPSKQRKSLIGETLGIDIDQVTTWFNNQRARHFSAQKLVEKMKREGQKEVIPQSWSALLAQ